MKKTKKTVQKRQKSKSELRRVIEYFVSGGVWFWSGYILIVVLVDPLQDKFGDQMGLFIANFIGNAVGITLNFILERYWVFKTKSPAKLGIATTRYIVYTALNAFLLNYLILLGLENIGIEPKIGQFIASGFFTVWNYFWYKHYVFKGIEKPRRTRHHA